MADREHNLWCHVVRQTTQAFFELMKSGSIPLGFLDICIGGGLKDAEDRQLWSAEIIEKYCGTIQHQPTSQYGLFDLSQLDTMTIELNLVIQAT